MISEIDTDSSGTVDFDGKLINLITCDVTFCQKTFIFSCELKSIEKYQKVIARLPSTPCCSHTQ